MKDILEGLNLIKNRLAEMDYFTEAKICKDLISRLKGENVINVSNNKGQINISNGNGVVNARQNVRINSPLNTGNVDNQTINYSTRKGFPFDWED